MHERQKNFKAPPKRFQPGGLSVLYEDRDILVVNKINGLLTVSSEKVVENTAYHLLNQYVRKGNSKSKNRVFIVHRLDRDTSGVIIFAKSENAKRYLQDQWQEFEKKYYAVVQGTLPEKEGVITSYLAENSVHRMYSVDDPGPDELDKCPHEIIVCQKNTENNFYGTKKGKLARTGYKVLRESKKYTLLEIDLLTGRKNQIRVHFSEKGCPVVGDKKYGRKEKGIKRLALHAASLTILHPHTKEKMTFETKIPPYFEALLKS